MIGVAHPNIDRVQNVSTVLTVAMILVAAFVGWQVIVFRNRKALVGLVACTCLLVAGLWVKTASTVECIEEAGGQPGGCSFFGENIRTSFGD